MGQFDIGFGNFILYVGMFGVVECEIECDCCIGNEEGQVVDYFDQVFYFYWQLVVDQVDLDMCLMLEGLGQCEGEEYGVELVF